MNSAARRATSTQCDSARRYDTPLTTTLSDHTCSRTVWPHRPTALQNPPYLHSVIGNRFPTIHRDTKICNPGLQETVNSQNAKMNRRIMGTRKSVTQGYKKP